jgi:hypothetical protein
VAYSWPVQTYLCLEAAVNNCTFCIMSYNFNLSCEVWLFDGFSVKVYLIC